MKNSAKNVVKNKMTTVRLLRKLKAHAVGAQRTAGKMLPALLMLLTLSSTLSAQAPPQHWLHSGIMPPGAIGRQRLLSNGPLSVLPKMGCVQPVKIFAGDHADGNGATISIASGEGFSAGQVGTLTAGLIVSRVYRLKVTGIKNYESMDVYPTIELIDRLHPPAGKELKFPVPIELTTNELQMAAAGSFITRVVYVEDPTQALAVEQKPLGTKNGEQRWYEARPDEDPLIAADTLGRPIAIIRIGARGPGPNGPDARFTYGSPVVQLYGNQ